MTYRFPTLLVSLMVFSLGVIGKGIEAKKDIRKTYQLDEAAGAPEMIIDNFEGSVRVTGYDGKEIKLLVHQTVEAKSPELVQVALHETQLEITRTDNTIRCYANGPFRNKSGSSNFRGWKRSGYKVTYDFEVQVPQATAIRIKTVNGEDIEAENISGSFNVEHVNGDVNLSQISGSGRAYALDGDVQVQFDKNPAAECYFGSFKGEVRVHFRPGLSANMRIKTQNGRAYSDFPVNYLPAEKPVQTKEHGKFIYKSSDFQGVRVGEGGPELKFEALSGDIHILQQKTSP